MDLALRLEQAYISTIHGFGLRVLTEFAFESGSSPQPRLLNEDEQNALIRLASSRTELANEITANLAAYGYRYEFGSEKGPEEVFRDDLLEIVELLRSVGWRSTSSVYAEQAVAWIVERYGPTGEARALSGALQRKRGGAARGVSAQPRARVRQQRHGEEGTAEGLPQPERDPAGRCARVRLGAVAGPA